MKKKSFEDYLAIEAVNWSTLKDISRSPLHYKHRLGSPREDKIGLIKGRAVHTATLEPEKFSLEYVIFPGARRQGKAWDEFQAEHHDKTILKLDEYDKAWQASEAVRRHPEVKSFMRAGKPEQSFVWDDYATGLTCKGRVDWIGDVLFDLKSTGDIDARKFANIVARMQYHGQLAMYTDGANHKGEVFIVAVEIEPPFDVAAFQLDDDTLYAGRELYKGFLAKVAECRRDDVWLGKYPQREVLSLPRYIYADDEQADGTSVVVVDE